MRKNELVHLHALFRVLQNHLDEDDRFDEIACEEYEALDVSPQEVYKPKERHREAVLTLGRCLASRIATNGKYAAPEERESVTAES